MKKLIHLMLPAVLLASMAMSVRAETSYGGADWRVTFTDDEKMESSFKTLDINDTIYGMQPGDNAVVELSLKNENAAATNWYMTNKVLYSLEDRSANSGASGGAYTYRLIYTDKNNEETVLFDSDTVGGEKGSGGREGLREATAGLEDYFYLDTLGNGDSGKIRLEVALEGETQGNDYQNTLADLQMNFAVEMNPDAIREEEASVRNQEVVNREIVNGENPDREQSPGEQGSRAVSSSIVWTGDESHLTLFVVLTSISGTLLLLLALYGLAEKKKEEKKGGI